MEIPVFPCVQEVFYPQGLWKQAGWERGFSRISTGFPFSGNRPSGAIAFSTFFPVEKVDDQRLIFFLRTSMLPRRAASVLSAFSIFRLP